MSAALEHWRHTRNLTFAHLAVWFVFAFLIHWFASSLYEVSFFGWPLNYYMAAQGSLIAFVIQLFVFSRQQHAIDVKYGFQEDEL
jgi:putative solute:sodium symporter small subunit